MSRNLRRNSSSPPIYPLPNQPRINMAASGAGTGEGAPSVAEPVFICNENTLTGKFNLGMFAGQNIFLDKTKGLATVEQPPLSNASAPNIMEFLKMKKQLMGTVVTGVPTAYTAGVGSSPTNLIHQIPSISLDIVQRGAHVRFGTALADGNAIPAQPWMSVALDPANNNADKAKFYTRLHANIVVEIFKDFLTPNGWDDLMLQQHTFDFTDITGMKSYYGPTMIKVLIEEIDPTESVNVELHRQACKWSSMDLHSSVTLL